MIRTNLPTCLLFLLFGMALPLSATAAEWEATLKSMKQGAHNTYLFLRYQPKSSGGITRRPHVVTINFRRKGTFPVVMNKEQRIEVTGASVFKIGFYVQEGTYDVDIDVGDLLSGEHIPIRTEYRCMISPAGLSTSDIFLAYQPVSDLSETDPILDLYIREETPRIYFGIDIYGSTSEPLNVQAILYKEIDSLSSSNETIWLDIRKTSRSLQTARARTLFSDFIQTQDLSEGRYLLQVLIYKEDSLLLKPGTYFTLEGETRRRIFANLPLATRMMKYLLPPAELARLQAIPEGEELENAFRQAWIKLYGEEADDRMMAYFKRLHVINQRLEPEGEDWESDRGRIFLQYGDPLVKDITIDGKAYRRWTYAKWDLSFLFEKRNKGYTLVE